MNKKDWVVAWRSKLDGSTGEYHERLTLMDADMKATRLNVERPELECWPKFVGETARSNDDTEAGQLPPVARWNVISE